MGCIYIGIILCSSIKPTAKGPVEDTVIRPEASTVLPPGVDTHIYLPLQARVLISGGGGPS